MEKGKTIYYTDQLNDDFSGFTAKGPVINENWDYDDNSIGKKIKRFLIYRILIHPIAAFYSRVIFRRKIVGKGLLKKYKHTGIFMYGNHTQIVGDAFLQACITYPRTNYVLVNPANLEVPVIGKLIPALGALPIPSTISAYRNFKAAIEDKIKRKHPVVIYPEAHIWPYYTGIRPFADTSFAYPVNLDAPVFCFVNTYKKSKIFQRPRIITYIGGPFFPDKELNLKSARKKMRDQVYKRMTELASHSNVDVVRYLKKEADIG